jgi:gamma-glutamylaminecyclotransferase
MVLTGHDAGTRRGHQVIGELYEVDDETLARLDVIESVHLPTGYHRDSTEVVSLDDGSTLNAWVYFKSLARVEQVRSDYLTEYSDNRYVHKSRRPAD